MWTRGAICTAARIMVLAAFLVVSAVGGKSPARPVAEVSQTEYEVFSAYITGTFTGQRGKERVGDDISTIVIINLTQSVEHDPVLDEDNGPFLGKS